MHHSAQEGNFAALAYLIEVRSMDPDTPDVDGKTPLHYAQVKGHRIISDWLRKLPRKEGDPLPEWDTMGLLVSHT